MSEPLVSFVVPCYNLGHYLAECVESILAQTYRNLEVLIMDDCSPDNTPEVAQRFRDRRVRYIRNEPNLGHLRNYNRGIDLARGEYVWLISADDRLRLSDALGRYVQMFHEHPSVGYVFSPAVRLENDVEGDPLGQLDGATADSVFGGRQFLRKLVMANTVVAPSVLVRKRCYDEISLFPLNMPWGGDWYLWCMFALYYDVGYLAEPMVFYRRHTSSMTNQLTTQNLQQCTLEDVDLPWTIKRKAAEAGYSDLWRDCLRSAAREYAWNVTSKFYRTATSEVTSRMTVREAEESISRHASGSREKRYVRARMYGYIADYYFWKSEFLIARRFYWQAVSNDVFDAAIWLKLSSLVSGRWGMKVRKELALLRQGHAGGE